MPENPQHVNTDYKINPASAQMSPEVAKFRHTKWQWILLTVIIIFSAIGSFYILNDSTNTPGTKANQTKKNNTNSLFNQPSPTPLPFKELTIPYLRIRDYKSSLGEREVAYRGGNYMAYLTSYLSDGLKINGLLTIPDGEAPAGGWPAIVFVHGYIPPTFYETNGEAYASYVSYLASNGFVVFKIDLRGHGDSEGQPGGGYYGSDYVVDTLHAYAALQSTDFVNAKKIGMWGHSMAGNALMRSAAVKPDIPAIVIWAGAVYSYLDQRKYGIQDNSYRPPEVANQNQNRRRELFEKVGSPSAQSVFWQQVAPVYFLKDIKGAVEIHHAVDDSVVNIGYSRDLMTELDKTNVPHQLFEYQTGGHNIEGGSFTLAMQRTVAFYKKYLTVD